jgi:hypothetical protein
MEPRKLVLQNMKKEDAKREDHKKQSVIITLILFQSTPAITHGIIIHIKSIIHNI